MARFSDIKQGGLLKQKLDFYTERLKNPPPRRLNSRGDRPPSRLVFLNPFGLDISTDELVSVNNNTAGYTRLQTAINTANTGAEVLGELGSKTVASVGRFRPARVVTFENASKTKSTPLSGFTGQEYLKYAGQTFSCAFGRKAQTDDQYDAANAIKAILKARSGLPVNRVSITPERLYVK